MSASSFTVGILGGGQLAKMLALAAAPMNIRTICIDADPNACAKTVTEVIHASFDDWEKLTAFAKSCDVITLENENIPLDTLTFLEDFAPVYPNATALKTTQDRLFEKELFSHLNIPTNEYKAIHSLNALQTELAKMTLPCVVKTRRFGYDGKGQFVIRSFGEAITAWEQLGASALILESFVDFQTEVSLIATRNTKGHIVYYPLTENYHHQGILRLSQAPFLRPHLEKMAKEAMEKILLHFQYVGTLAIEFFVSHDQLLANEIAPRVHNSGHWTIEGATTSQFENHLRAVCSLSLGNAEAQGYSAMVNCIGTMPALDKIVAIPHAHYHAYGKAERDFRKVGHVTIHCPTKPQVKQSLDLVEKVYT